MADAHRNFAVSLVATAPSPATSGTSLVVTAGDGTKFPAVPFNATVWPANTQPTTANAEIVRVTAISTDTLTITRAQESSSARTVVVGDQIAATVTAKSLTDVERDFHPLGPTGALYEAWSRADGTSVNQIAIVSQRLSLLAIYLPAGVTVTSIGFVSGTTALSAGVHQLFGLYDDSAGSSSGTARALLRGSNDDTSTAWAANSVKSLNLTSSYLTTRAGLFYLGIMVQATVPTLLGRGTTGILDNTIAPILFGSSNTGLTALPNPANALATGGAVYPYGFVS